MRVRPSDLHTLPREGELHWTRPSFLNGFADYGVVYSDQWRRVQYTVDELGYVMLRGLVTNVATINAGIAIFVLPNALRPSVDTVFACFGSASGITGAQRVDVFPNGQIVFYPWQVGYPVNWMTLTSIRFKPDDIGESTSAGFGTFS